MTCEHAVRKFALETPDPVVSLHFRHALVTIKLFVWYIWCRVNWSRTRSAVWCTTASVTVVRVTGFRMRRGAIFSIVPMLIPAQTVLTKRQRVLVLPGRVRIRRMCMIIENAHAYILPWYGARVLHINRAHCGWPWCFMSLGAWAIA
jgi:hypothetical protein